MLILVEAVTMSDLGVDAADRKVHLGEAPRRVVGFLSPDRDVADSAAVCFDELLALHEHAARAAARVVDAALVGGEHLDEYGSYLDLKRKYDSPEMQLPEEAEGLESDERFRAMQRLLDALKLSPGDLEERQQALASHYRRYVELKQRFKAFEGSGE